MSWPLKAQPRANADAAPLADVNLAGAEPWSTDTALPCPERPCREDPLHWDRADCSHTLRARTRRLLSRRRRSRRQYLLVAHLFPIPASRNSIFGLSELRASGRSSVTKVMRSNLSDRIRRPSSCSGFPT